MVGLKSQTPNLVILRDPLEEQQEEENEEENEKDTRMRPTGTAVCRRSEETKRKSEAAAAV